MGYKDKIKDGSAVAEDFEKEISKDGLTTSITKDIVNHYKDDVGDW